jgi:hypothetical protein
MREHDYDCPRSQFWDAGEWECPCTCASKHAEEPLADEAEMPEDEEVL